MPIITFTQDEMRFIGKVGKLRAEEAVDKPNIASYDMSRMKFDDVTNHRLALMVEAATVKWFGLNIKKTTPEQWVPFYLSEHLYRSHDAADVLGIVECRRANIKTAPIPIREKDRELGALVVHGFVDYQWREDGSLIVPNEVDLRGWADSVQDWDDAFKPYWNQSITDTKCVYEKRSMDTFPYDEVLAGAL